MKTIGVLGGIGPQATMDFEARVHEAARRRMPPSFNSGYPPMIVHYHRRMPFVYGEDGRPTDPLTANPDLLRAARQVGAVSDFLVITSNAPHLVVGQIEQAAGREVLSMIDVTLDEIRRRGWKRIGVLGFGVPVVYTSRLGPLGIEFEVMDAPGRRRLDVAIGRLMEGREGETERQAAAEAVEELRGRGVEGIILGCTEIPLLLGTAAAAPDLANPLALLAEEAVRRSIETPA